MYDTASDETSSSKTRSSKKVSVLLYEKKPFVFRQPDGTFSGFMYDIWQHTSVALRKQGYQIEEHEENPESMSMKEAFALVANGTYHIAIGNFSVTKERITSVMFTRPILLNKFALGYIPDSNVSKTLRAIMYDYALGPLFSFGVIILMIELARRYTKQGQQLWDYLTALLFSNTRSFLSTRVNSNASAPIIWSNYLVIVLSLLFANLLQAKITAIVQESQRKLREEQISTQTIEGVKILAPKGYSNTRIWDKYHARTIQIDDSGVSLGYYFVRNQQSYDAIFEDYEVLKTIKQNIPELVITSAPFGYDELAWPIYSKSDGGFAHTFDILNIANDTIVSLQDTDEILMFAKYYLGVDYNLARL